MGGRVEKIWSKMEWKEWWEGVDKSSVLSIKRSEALRFEGCLVVVVMVVIGVT